MYEYTVISDEDNNENVNEQIGEIIRESRSSQNVVYKLTCQCESTISSAFTL